MKRLITIILALIMTLFATPNQGANQTLVTAVYPPQTAITTQVKQVPEESETTAETALVDNASETGETAASKNEAKITETEVLTVETTVNQETPKEESKDINEETTNTEPEEETVGSIDKGDQNLAKYNRRSLGSRILLRMTH